MTGSAVRHAETVTFGGAGLDRSSDLRTEAGKISRLLNSRAAQVLPVWRSKLPIEGATQDRLVFRPANDPVFADATNTPVFLGQHGKTPYFARDISAWRAPEQDTSQLGSFTDSSEQTHPDLKPDQRFVELRRIMARLSPLDAEIAAMAVGVFSWHRHHSHCSRCGVKTEIAQGGWQSRCSSCNSLHFPRTDPVVIMHVTCGNQLLVGRSPGWPEGMYSLLAGFMEPGETIEAAVRREVFEETRVTIGAVSYLASQPWPFPSSLMIGCLARATSRDITIDPVEIEDAKWISREQVLEGWANPGSTSIAMRKGAIAHFLIKNWLSDILS
jgi:NAD+ diphosphatase